MPRKIEDIIVPKNDREVRGNLKKAFLFGRFKNESDIQSDTAQGKMERVKEMGSVSEQSDRRPDTPLNSFLAQSHERIEKGSAMPEYAPPGHEAKGSKGKNAFLDTYMERRRGNEAFVGRDKRKSSKFPIIVFLGLAALLVFIVLSIFSGATVTVVPFERTVAVGGEYTAKKDAIAGELPFKLLILNGKKTKDMPATIEQMVERKASGRIVIYNEYSGASQRFIKNTRFETPRGKIYRINESIVVPGTTMVGGKTVPGSIEVTVYADAPGEDYNEDLTDFTIPGLKGDPRYEKFYGRSKTPLSGGFKGAVKTVSESERETARAELIADLGAELATQAVSQLPPGFMMYDTSVIFRPDAEDIPADTNSDILTIAQNGTLYVIIFEEREFARYLAAQFIPSYEGEPVTVVNIRDLPFSITESSTFDPLASNTLKFSLMGSARIVWNIDDAAISEALAGKEKGEFTEIIKQYRSIQKAQATVRPFWKNDFPRDPKDIKIVADLVVP